MQRLQLRRNCMRHDSLVASCDRACDIPATIVQLPFDVQKSGGVRVAVALQSRHSCNQSINAHFPDLSAPLAPCSPSKISDETSRTSAER